MGVKITEVANITDYEKEKFKKEEDFLMVGKTDKSINVVSQGELINIVAVAEPTRSGSNHGYLKIPTSERDRPYVIQYGLESVTAASTDIAFPTPFANACLTIQMTHRGGDATAIKGRWVNATTLRIEVVGGTGTQTVLWQAMGF